MDIGSRISKILIDKGITQYRLSKDIGISPSSIANYINGETKPDISKLKQICEYLGITIEELTDGTKYEKSYKLSARRVNEQAESKISEGKIIRYYDIEASATPTEMYDLSSNIKYRDIVVPGFSDCEIAVNVWGDSMEPILHSGEIVLMKEWKERFIEFGQIYMIVTTGSHRMIKYVRPGKKPETISCESENDYYSPVEIEKEDILKMYLVKGRISRNAI